MKNFKSVLILLNYNDPESVLHFLSKIKNYKTVERIILVDNLSTDNSFEIFKKLNIQNLDLIKTPFNGGYAYGNNYGFKFAYNNYHFDSVIFSNPDVYLDEKTLIKLQNFLEKLPNCAQISCMMNSPNLRVHNSAWKLPKFSHNLFSLFFPLRKLHFKKYMVNNDDVLKVDVLNGAFFLITTKAFLDVGLFDESTFLYGEENILAFKLKQKGYNNYLIKDSYFFHLEEISINKSFKDQKKKYQFMYKSNVIYNNKYLKVNFLQKTIYFFAFKLSTFLRNLKVFLKV